MLRVGERVEEEERSTCLPFPLLWCQSPSGAPKRRRLRMKDGEEGEEGRLRSASHSQHPAGCLSAAVYTENEVVAKHL